MREIKFRAYDTMGERMLYSKVFSKAGATVKSFMAFEYPYPQKGNRPFMGWAEMDLSEPMQYTGLKDKNGKEIYEGDIFVFNRSLIGVVIYAPLFGAFQIQYMDSHLDNIVQSSAQMPLHEEADYTLEADKLEIAANIYENKDQEETEVALILALGRTRLEAGGVPIERVAKIIQQVWHPSDIQSLLDELEPIAGHKPNLQPKK